MRSIGHMMMVLLAALLAFGGCGGGGGGVAGDPVGVDPPQAAATHTPGADSGQHKI